MSVTHYLPRRRTHITRKAHQRGLALCFAASLAFILILAFVSWVWGQEHPFPFKTLEDITTGTPAWVSDGLPDIRMCRGTSVTVAKYQFKSGAESVWVVYTDGTLFAAAYFPPGVEGPPVTVVTGSIKDGREVIVESNVPFTGTQRPCDRWLQKSAGGSDGC